MAEEISVVLNRSDNSGFGFSLLGKPGLPPIIYNILEDSPAAESGEVEVGDVILKVNETDVNRFSTKEDPKIKASLRKHLLTHGDSDMAAVHKGGGGGGVVGALTNTVYTHQRPEPAIHQAHAGTNGSCPEQEPLLAGGRLEDEERLQWEPLLADGSGGHKPKGQPKFEAFTMTGEYIINISRTQQSLIPKQQKKVDNLRYHNSHTHHLRHQQQQQQHNSVPNSPNEMDIGYRKSSYCKSGSNSANTSPISANKRDSNPSPLGECGAKTPVSSFNNFVRTSRSEDQLQDTKNMSAVDIEIDDDVTSSLNTLLDTRPDSGSTNNVCSSTSNSDRIVWTYNAPVTTISEQHKLAHTLSNGSSSSHTSPSSTSPLRSGSPASPTSMSSSVMSSHSGSRRYPYTLTNGPHTDSGQYNQANGDFSVSEAISNISSPDYHDDDSMGIRDCVMEISDHSDSDSTLLVSEPRHRHPSGEGGDHRIVIQVKGPDKDSNIKDRAKFKTSNDTLDQEFEDDRDSTCRDSGKEASPTNSSEEDSDVDSLLSFHYSPKAVDMPSAIRLAKRLYGLDGFKKSDVSRHLSKNNDFSRAVGDEYLKYFDFEQDTLDIALRKFLKQFPLTGETQERERVLVPFSKRFLDCNPGSFNSQDAVHTLTCAIMLLNTDLHGQNINRKMTCNEFIENLSGLNEKENFPREVLKQLYHAIKSNPLEWALDDDGDEGNAQMQMKAIDQNVCGNPFLEVPSANATEYKKGYVMRKCCYEANAKRSLCCIFLAPFHKRSWKMFYCTLRDLVLYLHKDENGFRKNQMGDNFHNAIRIHHALASLASDYTKKQYVFRLQTADQAEYLFQTSDSKELQSWIDTINFVCASFSAPPLEAAVGSQKKFQRPLLPCSHTKLSLREQLRDHEERVMRLQSEIEEHRKYPPERGAKSLIVQNYKEKEAYLTFELRRYTTYVVVLKANVSRFPEPGICVLENSIGEMEDEASGISFLEGNVGPIVPPPIPERKSPPINRYSYRQAIYNRNMLNGEADIG